jgi:hypothetical protein
MAFVPLKAKSAIIKVGDLYGKWLIGKYQEKTKSDFSFIYWLEDESGQVTKIYGNKSLDSFMDDSLLGQMLAITCIELRDTGKGHPFAVASVAIWDPSAPDHLPAAQVNDPNFPKPLTFE